MVSVKNTGYVRKTCHPVSNMLVGKYFFMSSLSGFGQPRVAIGQSPLLNQVSRQSGSRSRRNFLSPYFSWALAWASSGVFATTQRAAESSEGPSPSKITW